MTHHLYFFDLSGRNTLKDSQSLYCCLNKSVRVSINASLTSLFHCDLKGFRDKMRVRRFVRLPDGGHFAFVTDAHRPHAGCSWTEGYAALWKAPWSYITFAGNGTLLIASSSSSSTGTLFVVEKETKAVGETIVAQRYKTLKFNLR